MICYQDEKMYGPFVGTITKEQLEDDIRRLEEEIYGEDSLRKEPVEMNKRPMIYDVKLNRLVERK
ncbi:MAG: hypothetical protein MJ105_06145 [Lachnospiraceae bacterium]|nr:hypothetical protein [Lachnospiraceae bacterium]